VAQAARCLARAPIIALSGVTLAAAAALATLSIYAAALALSKHEQHRPLAAGARTADRPVGCDARRHSCVGYALDLCCCSRSLRSMNGTGRSLLGARTADRPVGCDARRRGCDGHALDLICRSRSLALSEA
jgi:hypothetical protein